MDEQPDSFELTKQAQIEYFSAMGDHIGFFEICLQSAREFIATTLRCDGLQSTEIGQLLLASSSTNELQDYLSAIYGIVFSSDTTNTATLQRLGKKLAEIAHFRNFLVHGLHYSGYLSNPGQEFTAVVKKPKKSTKAFKIEEKKITVARIKEATSLNKYIAIDLTLATMYLKENKTLDGYIWQMKWTKNGQPVKKEA